MKKTTKRPWGTRLIRLPLTAGEQLAALHRRIPQKIRFAINISIFSILTTLFVSHYPLTTLPAYKTGDIAASDVVVPADLIARDEMQLSEGRSLFKGYPVLLRAGEKVTEEKLLLIDAVRRYQQGERSPAGLFGLLVITLWMSFAMYKTTVANHSTRFEPRTTFWVAITAIMIQAFLARVGMFGAAVLSTRQETLGFAGIFELQLAIPFAFCSLVLSLLIGGHAALAAGLMSAILVGFISPHGLSISVFALTGSIMATYSAQRYRTRNAVMAASAFVALSNAVMAVVVLMINNHEWSWSRVAGGIVMGLLGGLLTAATASLAIPIYESVFNILTDMKLMELSNADNPVLRQLAIQTPGTNHHSFMVGVLAEEAAKVIGANALLARTACLYHDIGKLAAPNMYIENQKGGPNPHDKVSPLDSVRIITGHVKRGVQMAEEARLPWQLVDFIPQHHGTRVLAYFYHKAKAKAEARGETVNIDDFRYPGPKPQTKEAVILMLADGAEASVRSLEDPSPENIRAIIKKIVESVVADGQLDESDVTMRELTSIRESLINTLINIHHQRISYPGFNPPTEAEKRVAGAEINEVAAETVGATTRIGKFHQEKQRAKAKSGKS